MALLNSQKSTDVEFKDNVCRGCLLISPVELPPFDDSTRIFLNSLSQIAIFKESKLPHRLCRTCSDSLKQCITFKNQCYHANKILTELLQISINNKSQFDLNDLRQERKKLFEKDNVIKPLDTVTSKIECDEIKDADQNDTLYSIDSEQNSFHESLLDPHGYFKPILPLFHKENNSRSDNVCPERIYNKLSDNFVIIDSNPLANSSLESGSVETEINAKQVCDQDLKKIECQKETVDKKLSNRKKTTPGAKRIRESVPKKTLEEIYSLSRLTQEPPPCLNPIQNDAEKDLETVKTDLNPDRKTSTDSNEESEDEKKEPEVKKKPTNEDWIFTYPLDHSKVTIEKLTVKEQLRELDEARSSYIYLNSQFKCETCAKVYLDEDALKKHLVKHNESSGQFMCSVCKLRYPSQKRLDHHGVWFGHDRFECKKCGFRITGRANMTRHYITHTRMLTCRICNHVSESLSSHQEHAKIHNDGSTDERVECSECLKSYKNQTTLKYHILRVHSTKLADDRENPDSTTFKFECEQCKNRYKTPLQLHRHVESVHLHLSNYTCDECPAKFRSVKFLMRHKQRQHMRQFICYYCGQTFKGKVTLKIHILIHTGEKPHSCGTCGQSFRQMSALVTHVKLVHLNVDIPHVYKKLVQIQDD